MMYKLGLALALLLLPTMASAQCNGVFPARTICGNSSLSPGLPGQIPQSAITGVPAGTNGQIQYNSGGLFGGFTTNGDVAITPSTGATTVNNINGVPINPAGAITNDTLAYNGTSFVRNTVFALLNAICSATPTVCVTFFGYADPIWYGASVGAVDNSTAINAATAASKLVKLTGNGAYKIAVSIKMYPNQRFTCPQGATITQGTAINLAIFIDMFTNVANGAQLDHCVIDGNRASNNTNINTILVDVSGTGNNTVSYNQLLNSSGGAIGTSNTTYLIAEHNYISNCIAYGISVFNTVASVRSYSDVHNNTIIGPMLHLIQYDQTDGNNISYNKLLQGVAIGTPSTPMRVNIAGSTVTWVSGPDFTGITLGSVLVVNGGVEYPINAINSNTSITISGTATLSNVLASWGGGDVLSLTSTAFNTIEGNFISGGVTGGIVLAQNGGNITSTESSVGNLINGNFIENAGQFSIALEALTNTGNPIVGSTIVTNNYVIAPGRAGGGIPPVGIQLYSVSSGMMPGVIIDGNYLYDPFAVTGGYWVSGTGSPNATLVQFGYNIQQGFTNGSNMNGYPTFASLATMRGANAHIIDGLAANCSDAACTTWGANVTGGGGALKLNMWYNGTNWTIIGK